MTGRAFSDETEPVGPKRDKSVLKNIDACISMKFYGGNASSQLNVTDSVQLSRRKKRREKAFTRFIPYSENDSPLPCSMSSPKTSSEGYSLGNENRFSVLTPSKLSAPSNVPSTSEVLGKAEPVSPLPKAAPVYSLASSYFPNFFPFEINSPPLQLMRSSMPDAMNTPNRETAGLDVDATEPYTRAALSASCADERDELFYRRRSSLYDYDQGNRYSGPVAAANVTLRERHGVPTDGGDVGRSMQEVGESGGDKYNVRDLSTTSSSTGRAYKMKHPVKCRHCDRTFWSHTGRYYHEAIHTGKWLFQCKHCDAGFMQRKAYDSHMRAKHKPKAVESVSEDGQVKDEGDSAQ